MNKQRDRANCFFQSNSNLIPDWRPQTVSDHDVDLVKLLLRRLRGRKKVSADLADVLRAVAVVPVAVLPEVTNGKLFPIKRSITHCSISLQTAALLSNEGCSFGQHKKCHLANQALPTQRSSVLCIYHSSGGQSFRWDEAQQGHLLEFLVQSSKNFHF